MSFLLDTDTCSAHLKRPSGLMHRFIQHSGHLYVSTITLAELMTWAFRRDDPMRLLTQIEQDLLGGVDLLVFDRACAEQFGRARGMLLRSGLDASRMDLLNASVALTHDLILVTHNTQDYRLIPGLRLVDWLSP